MTVLYCFIADRAARSAIIADTYGAKIVFVRQGKCIMTNQYIYHTPDGFSDMWLCSEEAHLVTLKFIKSDSGTQHELPRDTVPSKAIAETI